MLRQVYGEIILKKDSILYGTSDELSPGIGRDFKNIFIHNFF
jgi:hypothetical protein